MLSCPRWFRPPPAGGGGLQRPVDQREHARRGRLQAAGQEGEQLPVAVRRLVFTDVVCLARHAALRPSSRLSVEGGFPAQGWRSTGRQSWSGSWRLAACSTAPSAPCRACRFSEEDYRFVRRLIIRIILATGACSPPQPATACPAAAAAAAPVAAPAAPAAAAAGCCLCCAMGSRRSPNQHCGAPSCTLMLLGCVPCRHGAAHRWAGGLCGLAAVVGARLGGLDAGQAHRRAAGAAWHRWAGQGSRCTVWSPGGRLSMSALCARLRVNQAPAAQHTDTPVPHCTPRSSSSWWCTPQTSPTRRARCRCAAAGARRCTRSCLLKVRVRQLAAVFVQCSVRAAAVLCIAVMPQLHACVPLAVPAAPTAVTNSSPRSQAGCGCTCGPLPTLTPAAPAFNAGDKEAALGLAVSFICDRRRASVPQSQLTFVEYVVKPCFRCALGHPARSWLRTCRAWLQAAPALALAESCVHSLVCSARCQRKPSHLPAVVAARWASWRPTLWPRCSPTSRQPRPTGTSGSKTHNSRSSSSSRRRRIAGRKAPQRQAQQRRRARQAEQQ